MGLEAVVGEIRVKGQKEAEKIREETRGQVRQILETSQEKVEKIKTGVEESIEKQVRHLESQVLSAANLVVKRERLNAQKALLDDVYEKTLESLKGLPDSFHREALRSLLLKARQEIPEGIVHCNARDMQALEDIIAKEQELRGYTAGGVKDIEGGVIVESRDGTLQIDFSYRTFLNQVWETGLKDASDILFG
ncbi:MAG TPA: V-type ATP synthase subunit E family protein [Methanoregulaceae archaeon]|nr:V-type ATP synthase subunit E family protein [Methanoregulaceae archaeon]